MKPDVSQVKDEAQAHARHVPGTVRKFIAILPKAWAPGSFLDARR